MTYAMVLQNRVIGVLQNQTEEPHWPPDPAGNPVTTIPCEDTVTLGMIYVPETGTFSEPEPPAPLPKPEPTQLDRIESRMVDASDTQLIIMEAMADQYEQHQADRLNDMDVQATIYEEILLLKEASGTM